MENNEGDIKIKITTGGLWGGYIPDVSRNDKVKLHFNNLAIELSGKDFEEFKKIAGEKAKETFEQCSKVVKRYDRVCEVIRQTFYKLEKEFGYYEEGDEDSSFSSFRNQELTISQVSELENILSDLWYYFWAGKNDQKEYIEECLVEKGSEDSD